MIGDPEIWPNDDPDDHQPKGEELAREVLDNEELAEYLQARKHR